MSLPADPQQTDTEQMAHEERWELLEHINTLTDKPMIALSFVWLGLLIYDFTIGISPFLLTISNVIWALFVLDFAIEFTIAPSKTQYLRRNWLTAFSLMLPALRLFQVFRVIQLLRAARAVRSLNLIRLLTSLNRGMRAVGRTLGRHGVGYVVALTILVTFGGAAGMALFESPASVAEAGYTAPTGDRVAGIAGYGEAVWWTAMIMTTMGSEYWPRTVEGRLLGWLLSVYAFAVFGYITATIASYFIGQDRPRSDGSQALAAEIAQLRKEIAALHRQIELTLDQREEVAAAATAAEQQSDVRR